MNVRLQLLEWRASIDTWASVYFLGHILMGSIILVSLVNPPRRPRKKEVAKEAATLPQPPIETGKSCLGQDGIWHRPCYIS